MVRELKCLHVLEGLQLLFLVNPFIYLFWLFYYYKLSAKLLK